MFKERGKQSQREKYYGHYDWLKLAMDGSLKSLKVLELNNYLDANGLTKAGRKEGKIKAIACHIIRANTNSDAGKTKIEGNLETFEDEDGGEGEEDSDTIQSDEDELLAMLSEDSPETNDEVQKSDWHGSGSDDEFQKQSQEAVELSVLGKIHLLKTKVREKSSISSIPG